MVKPLLKVLPQEEPKLTPNGNVYKYNEQENNKHGVDKNFIYKNKLWVGYDSLAIVCWPLF